MLGNVKIHTDDKEEVNPIVASEIYNGLFFLREWLDERKKNGKVKKYMLNDAVYNRAVDCLDDMNVFVSNDGQKRLIEAIEKGELHFRDEVLERYGNKEKALEAIKKVHGETTKSRRLGFNCVSFIKEPAIFIEIDNYMKRKDNIEAPSISSLVIHEATHALKLNVNESMIKRWVFDGSLNEGVEFDKYRDRKDEVYARLMQLRNDLALLPDEVLSVEDVAKMRKDCEARRGMYKNPDEDNDISKMDKNDAKSYIKKGPKNIDYSIFERYSDEQIMNMLNTLADLPETEKQNMERSDLFGAMKKDFLLADTQGRVVEKLMRNDADKVAPKSDEAETKDKKTNTTTIDNKLIFDKINEQHYS